MHLHLGDICQQNLLTGTFLPSLEIKSMAFDDPFNSNEMPTNDETSNNFYNFADEDPAAEFLAREKRELSDITGENGENAFADPFDSNNEQPTNGAHSPTMNINGSHSPVPSDQYQALSQLNEPETIQKWREEFSSRINKKDAEEESKRLELREQAKKELDDFYKQRVEQMERVKGQNRLNNRTLEDDLFSNGNHSTSNGTTNDWDKITSLCEFNPKNNRSQKDMTRYRSVLLQLKQQQQTSAQ